MNNDGLAREVVNLAVSSKNNERLFLYSVDGQAVYPVWAECKLTPTMGAYLIYRGDGRCSELDSTHFNFPSSGVQQLSGGWIVGAATAHFSDPFGLGKAVSQVADEMLAAAVN